MNFTPRGRTVKKHVSVSSLHPSVVNGSIFLYLHTLNALFNCYINYKLYHDNCGNFAGMLTSLCIMHYPFCVFLFFSIFIENFKKLPLLYLCVCVL